MALVRLLRTLFFLPGKYHLSAGTSLNPLENNGIYPEIAVPVYNRFPFPIKRRRIADFMPKAIIMCLVLVVMSSAKVMAAHTITVGLSPVTVTGITYGTVAATPNSFTVTGTGLTANITVAAPPAGFETSTAIGGPFNTTTITLTQVGGNVALTTIYIRLRATATVAGSPYSGTINVTSTGAGTNGVATINASTVGKATLTVTANNVPKTYGTLLTGASGSGAFTSSGLKNGETIGSVTIAYGTGAAANASVASSPYNGQVTASAATGGTFTASNYTISYNTGNITVSTKALTLTATAISKVYGTTYTFLGTEFTQVGSVAGDITGVTLTSSGAASTATVIGGPTYPITITPGSATGPGIANYTFSYATANMTVTKATLTVNIGTLAGATKTYDATTTATLTGTAGSLNGIVNSDVVNLGGAPTAVYASAAAGNPVAVTVSGYTISGAGSGNYTLTQPTGVTGIISPAPLTLTATGPLKTYGTALTAGTSATNFTYSGTIGAQTVTSVTLTPDANGLTASLPVGSAYVVTPSAPTGGGGFLASNYTITVNVYNGTETAAVLTVTCGTLSQVYGAVDVSSIPNLYTITGYVNGDTQATAISTLPSNSCSATNASGVAGSPYAITASGAAATSSNYTFFYVPGSFSITPATLTIAATGPAKVAGQTLSAGSYTAFFSTIGLVNGESLTSLTLTPSPTTAQAAGAAYTVTPSAPVGFTISNYSITYTNYSGVCGNSYTWTGASGIDQNWNDAANWNPSTGFPGATDNVTIPTTFFGPTVNVASQCNTLTFTGINTITINSGLTLLINEGLTVNSTGQATITNASTTSTLQIGTNSTASLLTNLFYFHLSGGILSIPSGKNYITNSGTCQLDGGVSFDITGNGTTGNNAIINSGFFFAGIENSTGDSPCYLTFDDSQSILNQGTGSFYLGPTSVMKYYNTLAHDCHVVNSSGGVFTLQSDQYGSASILAIPQNATHPNTYVGTFTVERYVSGNRAYRLLSSQVYASTVSPNNVYDISYLKNSAYLTGTNGTAGGFDKAGNPTLYLYRENNVPLYTTFLNSNFRGINNISSTPTYGMDDSPVTSANIPVGSGFLFFYRGNRNSATYTEAQQFTPGTLAESVTLSAQGKLNLGTIVVHDWYTPSSAKLGWTTTSGSVNIEGFNLVGNPYPCSIDWDQFSSTSSGAGIYGPNVGKFSYQLIPTGLQGAGNYNVYQAGTGGTGNQGTLLSNIIASGEGFFVQALNSSAALTFNETSKTSTLATGGNLYMGAPPLAKNNQYLRLQIALDSINVDGMIVRFDNNTKAAFDINEDAIYRSGSGKVSLSSLSSDNMPLAINQQPLLIKGQTIPINVNATANGTYKLNMAEIKGIPQLLGVWLKDNLLKDSVNMRATNSYSFTITKTDTTTFGSRRFALSIRQDTAYAYRLLTFDAKKAPDARAVQVAWTSKFEENYTNFTVERSTDNGKTFEVLGGVSASAAGSYGLTDTHPFNGLNLYRLRSEDINNVITYSRVVPIGYSDQSGRFAKNNLDVFPNPSKGDINLVVLNDLTNATGYNIMISNSLGFVIKKGTTGQANWQASVADLLPGTYLVKVYNNKDQSLIGTTKFVKL